MNITIDNFENFVPFKILQRGQAYFEEGAIRYLEETEDGVWTAEVEGTVIYEVEITLDPDGSIAWSCDCPYDWGSMCKHVVAVLLAIRKQMGNNPKSAKGKSSKSKKVIKNTEVEDAVIIEEKKDVEVSEFDQLMQLVKADELRQFAQEYAVKDNQFCESLTNYLRNIYLKKPETKTKDYRKMMVNAFQHTCRGRSRYDYYESNDWYAIFNHVGRLFEEARKLLLTGNPIAAISTGTQFLISLDEESDESLIYEEDIYVGDYCDDASELILEAITHQSVPDNIKNETIEELKVITSNSDLCQYYDFDIDELILKLTIETQTDEKALELLDDSIKSHAESYDLYTYVKRKIELLQKMKREKEAKQTTEEYLYLPEIRRQEVNKAISMQQYDKAIRLITEGVALAKEERLWGIEKDWTEHLLKVYELQQDIPGQTALSRQLFIMNRGSLTYYRKLKSLISNDEWEAFLKQLIADSKISEFEASLSILADIYVEERDWNDLFDYIKSATNRLDTLDIYAYHLRATHSPQLILMYCDSLKRYAAVNVGRNHYERIGKSMICMQKLEGGKKAVKELAADFRTLYKNRPAMRETLSKF